MNRRSHAASLIASLFGPEQPLAPRIRGNKYKPHQGAWECQRRLMQARGEWPRKGRRYD